ncbi:MAG: hypothetical protein V4735_02200 [Pseudomonadota bacterium]
MLNTLQTASDLVAQGIVIAIDSSSKAHEPARREIASALACYFNTLTGDAKKTANKALGLKAGETLRLTDANDDTITDRPLLGKALRLYQTQFSLGADGKVGAHTLNILQAHNRVGYGYGSDVMQTVLGENDVGYLGGKFNPCELQRYEANPFDPRNAEKMRAGAAFDRVRRILYALKDTVQTQPVTGNYTPQEQAVLKALLIGSDEKPAQIDPGNITNAGLQAFQKAFGLAVDKGVIGPDFARTLLQIDIRVHTNQAIDPSDIRAAVTANGRFASAKPTQKNV